MICDTLQQTSLWKFPYDILWKVTNLSSLEFQYLTFYIEIGGTRSRERPRDWVLMYHHNATVISVIFNVMHRNI
jgi:hypothetical protein